MPEAAPLHNRYKAPLTGAFLFFGSSLVYLLTLSPTVTFWDSGELTTAAWQLGISHQPGYPLFAMLGRLFACIPLGAVAFRVNLMSAFFAASAVYIVYKAMGAGFIAFAAALMLAFSGVFWSQAVVTEVYAINAFFLALLVYLHLTAASGKLSYERYVPLSGLCFGLGVVNHESLVLYLPALMISWMVIPCNIPVMRIKRFVIGVFSSSSGSPSISISPCALCRPIPSMSATRIHTATSSGSSSGESTCARPRIPGPSSTI